MSKVRVDQLSPTDDSVTVNVKDLEVVNNLVNEAAHLPGIVNIGQRIADRKAALSSNTIRFCTWNIQTYYIKVDRTPSDVDDTVDVTRFNRDESSQQLVREHVEWLLKIGADVVAMQELDADIETKYQDGAIETIGSNWRMYPYSDSYLAIDSWLRAKNQLGNPGGNMLLSTRSLSNGSTLLMEGTSTESTRYKSLGRCEINVNGTTVAVYTTHLSIQLADIQAQIALIAAALSSETATHVVLMGDMNWNDDAVYQPIINLGYTMVNKNGELNTYNGGHLAEWAPWYLDRIFHKGFSSQGSYGVETPPRELGDHKPLWVDLTI